MGRLLLLGECDLAFGDEAAARACVERGERLCAWCGSALPPRRRRWCSDACSRSYGENHSWGFARARALARDGQMCRVCFRGPGASRILALLLSLWGHDPREAARRFVDESGEDVWRGWTLARLEVNHVLPRLGRGYTAGCWNHLANLEALCHAHHVETTRDQRRALRAGLIGRVGPVGWEQLGFSIEVPRIPRRESEAARIARRVAALRARKAA